MNLLNLFGSIVYAAEGGEEIGGMGLFGNPLIMLLLMVGVFYFIIIMPQRKKDKKLREMIAALKVTDEVVTIGGIRGKVIRIKDDTILLETGIGTQKSVMQIERSAISRLTKEGAGVKKAEIEDVEEADDTAEE